MKKINIVKSNREFNEVINKGIKHKNTIFCLYILNNDYRYNRYGIAVSKKIGNAVTRNKLKRQVRNIIDNNKMLFKKDRFYIIICRKECLDITFEEMNNELKKLLLKEKDDEK